MKTLNKKTFRHTAFAAFSALVLSANVFGAAVPVYAAESSWNLQDNVIDFDEVGELVENYSMLAELQKSTTENMTSSFDDVYAALQDNYQEAKDDFDDGIEELTSLRDETTDSETRKQLNQQISALRKQKKLALDQISAYWNENTAGGSGTNLAKTKQQIVSSIASGYYSAKQQMTYGYQSAIYTYKGLELNQKLLNQQIAMYQASYEKVQKQQASGAATAADVQSALLNLNGAKINLEKIENAMDTLKRTIGTGLGWNTTSYKNISFGAVPEYPLDFAAGRNLESDIQAAQQKNSQYGTASRIKDEDFTTWDNREISIAASEQEIRIGMTSLLESVKQKQAEYTAAQTSAELAKAKKERADRMDAVGLVGRAEYDGLQLDYLNKANAVETARMNYSQAVYDYHMAVEKGIISE